MLCCTSDLPILFNAHSSVILLDSNVHARPTTAIFPSGFFYVVLPVCQCGLVMIYRLYRVVVTLIAKVVDGRYCCNRRCRFDRFRSNGGLRWWSSCACRLVGVIAMNGFISSEIPKPDSRLLLLSKLTDLQRDPRLILLAPS